MTADVNDGRNQALDLATRIPGLLPKARRPRPTSGSPLIFEHCGQLRQPIGAGNGLRRFIPAPVRDPRQNGGSFPAYRMTVVLNSNLGEYYRDPGDGVENAADPERHPSTESVGGKTLQIFKNGAHVSLVAYRTRRALTGSPTR